MINFTKTDFGAFIRELASQAKKLEDEQSNKIDHLIASDDSESDEDTNDKTRDLTK